MGTEDVQRMSVHYVRSGDMVRTEKVTLKISRC